MSHDEQPNPLRELGVALRAERAETPDAAPADTHDVERVMFRLAREKLLPAAPRPVLRGRAVALVAVLAVAAASLLWVGRETPSVQAFAVEVRNPSALRGAPEAAQDVVVRGTTEGTLELVLRPVTASPRRHGARVFARGADQRLTPVAIALQSAESGALRITMDRTALHDAYELVIVLGPESGLGDGRAAAEGTSDQGPGFRQLRLAVVP